MQQYGYQQQSAAAPWQGITGQPMQFPTPVVTQQPSFGQTLGNAALYGGTAMMMASDIRLKKNISKVGKYKGMDVIEFDYLWGGGRQRGLIAQQVKEVIPNAVGEIAGYLYIDYSKV